MHVLVHSEHDAINTHLPFSKFMVGSATFREPAWPQVLHLLVYSASVQFHSWRPSWRPLRGLSAAFARCRIDIADQLTQDHTHASLKLRLNIRLSCLET